MRTPRLFDAYIDDRMLSTKRIGLILFAIACGVAAVCVAYLLAANKAGNDIRSAGARQLQIIALDLESVLEKFETLPFALALQPDVTQVLARPDDRAAIDRLNRTLQAIQRQAKVGALYLMDRNGKTLASSNWDQPQTFVGKNFAFRPYFRDALNGKAGRFYGIGSTTNEPGYFIAQPVYPAGAVQGSAAPVGVMAVKISLAEFERTWRSSEEPIALADRNGVVFLSNRDSWKYHSLHPLDAAAQKTLAGTLQYAGVSVQPIAALAPAAKAGFGDSVAHPVGRLGWQLMLFPSHARIERVAVLSALATALLLAIGAVTQWAVYQRRRRMEEQLESRQALQQAAEELDRKIAQRTQDLLLANQNLESKFVKLKEAEHLLDRKSVV